LLYRLTPYRPVTPEVAGSSPVAPVKFLQKKILCCRTGRQIGADYTQFSRGDDETAKTVQNAVTGATISSRFRPSWDRSTKAARHYTK
jgi:hypothetical protein